MNSQLLLTLLIAAACVGQSDARRVARAYYAPGVTTTTSTTTTAKPTTTTIKPTTTTTTTKPTTTTATTTTTKPTTTTTTTKSTTTTTTPTTTTTTTPTTTTTTTPTTTTTTTPTTTTTTTPTTTTTTTPTTTATTAEALTEAPPPVGAAETTTACPAIPTTDTPTTIAPVPAPTLLAYQTVALNEINSIRATHGVCPLKWDPDLATAALTCSNTKATANSLTPACTTNPADSGEASGFNANNEPMSQGVRSIINDPTGGPNGGWFGQQWLYDSDGDGQPDSSCIDWSSGTPAYNSACSAYSAMIWNASTSVGCGYSASAGDFPDSAGDVFPQYVLVCLFNPAGNDPAQFAANVFADSDKPATCSP